MLTWLVVRWEGARPVVENPRLVDTGPKREQLVLCECGEGYRVWVNGEVPVPDVEMPGVVCPGCGRGGGEARVVCGHSGGYFNAMSMGGAGEREVGGGD